MSDLNIEHYVSKYHAAAEEAGKKYGLRPAFIMAQGAIESGWGTSLNALQGNNFFGVIATKLWTGKTRKASTGLVFRVYSSPEASFEDFARLITSKYHTAASSKTIEEYANAISKSPYISEANGDNRENYRRGIIWAYYQIMKTLQ